ncbi:MAG TPA: hypothetical protein VHK04_05635, partial [Castellaniella sp.]|nr:hypothetical protein [Castellaniella sp.]
MRTAGTAIAVLGALIWLAGIPLAWPDPARMIAVSAIGFVLFTAVALRYSLAPAHLLAAGCLSLVTVLAVHVWRGQLPSQSHDAALVVRVLLSAASGVALIPVCCLLAAAAALGRFNRDSALYHAISATVASLASLSLILWFDWGNAVSMAVPLFALAGVWLAVSGLMQWPKLFAAFQALLSLAVVMAVTSQLETQAWFQSAPLPWLDPWTLQAQAVALGLLGLIWVGVRIGTQRWSSAFRRVGSLLNPPWLAFDRVLNVALLIVLIGLSLYGALPGVAQELTPRKLAWELNDQPSDMTVRAVPPLAAFEVPGIPHQHALGYGTWLLAGLLIVVFCAGQWERYTPWRVFGVVAIMAMACPLIAAMWTPEVAAASALRWLAAGFLFLGSVGVWFREPLAGITSRLGWPGWGERPAALSADCRTLLLVIVVLFLALMGAYVALAAVLPSPLDPSVGALLPWLAGTFAVLAIISLVLRAVPVGQTWARQASLLLLILGAAPLVAVSQFVVTMALRGNPIAGPEPGSVFAQMGKAASYSVPILIIALSLVGHALRERSASFAFAAGLLFNGAATAGYLLTLKGAPLDAALWVRLAQLNALVSAIYALAWLGALLAARRRGPSTTPALLMTQVMLPVALIALILIPAGVTLWWSPVPTPAHDTAGSWLGWLSFLATLAAGAWLTASSKARPAAGTMWAVLAALATLAALAVSPWDTGNWLAFHTLLVGHTLVGALLLTLYVIRTPRDPSTLAVRDRVGSWCALGALTSGIIALRGAFSDPHGPWWSIGALAALAVLLAITAGWSCRQRFLYLAAGSLNLAATIFWFERMQSLPGRFASAMVELVE